MDDKLKVFNAIVCSSDRFPSQLRSMCHCLYQEHYLINLIFLIFFKFLCEYLKYPAFITNIFWLYLYLGTRVDLGMKDTCFASKIY